MSAGRTAARVVPTINGSLVLPAGAAPGKNGTIMTIEHYPYEIAAIYPDGTAAAAAVAALDAAALDDVRVVELLPGATGVDQAKVPESVLTRETVGRAAVKSPVLFVSAQVVGSLIVLGYGAVIGRTAGAIRGPRLHRELFAGLVKDALKAGYYVVSLHAANNRAQQHAEAVINATLPAHTAYI